LVDFLRDVIDFVPPPDASDFSFVVSPCRRVCAARRAATCPTSGGAGVAGRKPQLFSRGGSSGAGPSPAPVPRASPSSRRKKREDATYRNGTPLEPATPTQPPHSSGPEGHGSPHLSEKPSLRGRPFSCLRRGSSRSGGLSEGRVGLSTFPSQPPGESLSWKLKRKEKLLPCYCPYCPRRATPGSLPRNPTGDEKELRMDHGPSLRPRLPRTDLRESCPSVESSPPPLEAGPRGRGHGPRTLLAW